MEPLSSADGPADRDTRFATRTWHARVWQCWPGGHMPRLARLLAEDLVQSSALVVDLDQAAVRRILRQVNLRPPGLKQLLAKLVEAGLLVQLQPGEGVDWGQYRLELPRRSHHTANPPDSPEAQRNEKVAGLPRCQGRCAVSYQPEGTELCFVWYGRELVYVYCGAEDEPFDSFVTGAVLPARPPYGQVVGECDWWVRERAGGRF